MKNTTDPTIEAPATPVHKYSGGPIDEAGARQYAALRKLIKAEADVYDVLELARRSDGKWLYMIQCPLAWVYPKFVIGITDVENESVDFLFKCGAEWSARAEWDRQRYGTETRDP